MSLSSSLQCSACSPTSPVVLLPLSLPHADLTAGLEKGIFPCCLTAFSPVFLQCHTFPTAYCCSPYSTSSSPGNPKYPDSSPRVATTFKGQNFAEKKEALPSLSLLEGLKGFPSLAETCC